MILKIYHHICIYFFLLIVFLNGQNVLSMQKEGIIAEIRDSTGIKTKVNSLKTNQASFWGWYTDDKGFPIIIKNCEELDFGFYQLFLDLNYVDCIDVLDKKVKVGIPSGGIIEGRLLKATLSNGNIIEGSFEGSTENNIIFKGEFNHGEFQLEISQMRNLKILKNNLPLFQESSDRKAVIEFRDGCKIETKDLKRVWISRKGHSSNVNDIWIKIKRGAALVKINIPLEKINEINFENPKITEFLDEDPIININLADGTLLSGTLGGDTLDEICQGFSGHVNFGWFYIGGYIRAQQAFSYIGCIIKSIKFIE